MPWRPATTTVAAVATNRPSLTAAAHARRSMIGVRSRTVKKCDDVTGMYTQATDSCTVGNAICPTAPTGVPDYAMVSVMLLLHAC